MALLDEFVLCLEVFVIIVVGLLTIAHRGINMGKSPISVNQFALHSLFDGDFCNLLQASYSLLVTVHGCQHYGLLLHGFDDALLAVGGDILGPGLHLIIIF